MPSSEPWTSEHTRWLVNTGEQLSTADGKTVEVWEFLYENNEEVLSAWARHFRNHYCLDCDIDDLRRGYGYSRADYLKSIKFPDVSSSLGPSIRAGDFGEVLVADYLQYLLGYWVPRTRYNDKTIRNESTKGCDILGFKVIADERDTPEDALAVFETKTQFSGSKPKPKLQEALNDSAKDQVRKAESLNAIKQSLRDSHMLQEAKRVERFQDPLDRPYLEVSGAVALFSTYLFDRDFLAETNAAGHPNKSGLMLLVIRGNDMMNLVHELYRRAADEA